MKITVFQPMLNASIRAGILMDTSESMRDFIAANRAISIEYAQRLLRQDVDQAFVMDFGRVSKTDATVDERCGGTGCQHSQRQDRGRESFGRHGDVRCDLPGLLSGVRQDGFRCDREFHSGLFRRGR